MGFLEMNLARLGNINRTTGRMADRAFSSREARKARTGQGLSDIANMLFGSGQKRKERDFLAGESALGREATVSQAEIKAKALKVSEDKMYEQYENGSYKDDITGIDYTWNNQPEFQMQLSKMKADRDRYLAKLSAGDEGDESRISSLFAGILGELQSVFPSGGYDPSTNMYNKEWMGENIEDFRSSFDQLTQGYTPEQRDALGNLLNTYLKGYTISPEEVVDASDSTVKDFFKTLFPEGEAVGGAAGLERVARQAGEEKPITEGDNMWRVMQGMIDMVTQNKPEIANDPTMKSYMEDMRDGNMDFNVFEDFMEFLDTYGKKLTY